MLSVLIPCYNESEKLFSSLRRLSSWFKTQDILYEIIVINNGSTDDTYIRFKDLVTDPNISIINEMTKGKGFAVKKGLENCSFNKVLIVDADLSVDIDQLDSSWFLQKETLIVGSRVIGTQQGTPLRRQFAGKLLNKLIRKIFKLSIYDTQCGFKFLNTKNIKLISSQLTVIGFMYDLDLILSCKDRGLEVMEVPIAYNHDNFSSVSLFRDPLIMLKDIFKIYNKYQIR